MSLVYGSATIRLSGEGVATSAAERSVGNQAIGLAAATRVKGASRVPRNSRCPGAVRPAREASTLSNRGLRTGTRSPAAP